jgi:DNA-binding NtrC family response regulator
VAVTLRGLTILLVDDHEDLREMMEDLLAAEGCRVLGAGSYEHAVALASQIAVDVAVIDYRLGNENGLALLRELRARHVHLPAVIASGMDTVAEDVVAQGRTSFLLKPYDARTLLDAIRTIR